MIRISNFAVHLDNRVPLTSLAARRLGLPPQAVPEVVIVRKAVDARRYRGAPIQFVYVLDVTVSVSERKLLDKFRRDRNIGKAPEPEKRAFPQVVSGRKGIHRPVVVGFGPAGMFAALTLARAGWEPLVLERGLDVDRRRAAVLEFWGGGGLDPRSNVQFGEGGAGTFSDGKLTTRISDPRMADVLEAFVAAGAPEEIRYLQKPHIGTDLLCGIVKNIRKEILRLGGEIRFGAQVTDLLSRERVEAVIVNGEERIPAEAVLLGIGHSARDTYEMLLERGASMEAKAFATGVRIEHPQEFIDRAQYGEDAGNPLLPAADYAMTFKDGKTGRGAYSFCMCPGGRVVAAASEPGRVVTNGMSNYRRDSGIANAALLVTVTPEDFGREPLDGMRFQRDCERLAFEIAGGDYRAPVQTVGDFLKGTFGSQQFLTTPTYRPGVRTADLRRCLPSFVTETLAAALPHFDRKIPGFAGADVVMTGVETRSSAPCRILRHRESLQSVSLSGLYPIGEGAGYAGGIMSAAADGMKGALALLAQG